MLALIVSIAMISCNSGKDEPEDRATTTNPKPDFYWAVVQKNGHKELGNVLREIVDFVKYDSVTKKKTIVTDTICRVWWTWPQIDTLTKTILKTNDGKDSLRTELIPISKDSVNFKIENIPIRELVKMDSLKKQ